MSACGDAHFDKSLRSSSSLPRLPFLISWRGSTSNSPECFRPDVSLGLSLPPSTSGSFLLSSRFGRRVTLFRIPLYRIYQHPAEHAYLYDILCILFRRGKYRHFTCTHIYSTDILNKNSLLKKEKIFLQSNKRAKYFSDGIIIELYYFII